MIIGVVAGAIGITLYLTSTRSNETIQNVQNKTTRRLTFGNIAFVLPNDWKESSSGESYVSFISPEVDLLNPGGFTPAIGVELSVSKMPTDSEETECNYSKSDAPVAEDCENILMNGRKAIRYHINYEGHYLTYAFSYKRETYNFTFGTSDLSEEQKHYKKIESIVNSLVFF